MLNTLSRLVRIVLLSVLVSQSLSATAANGPSPKEMNRFIDKLMAKMTLEEKLAQLTQISGDLAKTGSEVNADFKDAVKAGHVGSMLNVYTPKFMRELQKLALENSRLHIPLLFGYDVIHGHRTMFPIPLGEAASWDLKLMQKSARIAATEAAADGIDWTFAPMVDITRDPRWGRVMEGSGEDPWLGSKIATVRVHGFQGDDLAALDSVLACVKHFAVYGAPLGGRDYNSVDMSDRMLREVYLPPYEAAIKAGVATVMTSFNDVSGIPATANEWLMTTLLRKDWKFKGLLVTDYTAINELVPHGVAADEKEAAMLSLKAGVDMDMVGRTYIRFIPALLKEGKVKMSQVNTAVRRVLEAKYKRGLFQDPYRFIDDKRAEQTMMKPEFLAHAREAGRQSIVLLKNENRVLPLQKTAKIALIGPMVENKRDQIGSWSAAGDPRHPINLLEGVRQVSGGKGKILVAKGANLLEDDQLIQTLNLQGGDIHKDPRPPEELIKEAVKVAKSSDVIVLALGEPSGMSGEAASRTHITLPENQRDLLKALRETQKPIVLVLFNGRPLVLDLENGLADAMVEAWFLGSQAGLSIADVLYGDYNPSGKITMTFPRSEGQIPIYYSVRNTGRPFVADNKYSTKYLDSPNEPLFPFGWGLSYTQFTYGEPKLSSSTMKPKGKMEVTVKVTNSGDADGTEVVQMYVRDMVASVSRPVKELRGFEKIFLKKGESRDVTMELTLEDLKFFDKNMKWISEPGVFKVMVGSNSSQTKEAEFTLLK